MNTYLGETWEDEGERVDDFDIANHREPYGEKLPNEVVFLTTGVDVQDDSLQWRFAAGRVTRKATVLISKYSMAIHPQAMSGLILTVI